VGKEYNTEYRTAAAFAKRVHTLSNRKVSKGRKGTIKKEQRFPKKRPELERETATSQAIRRFAQRVIIPLAVYCGEE